MDTMEQFKKDVAEDGCGDVGSLIDEIEHLRTELADTIHDRDEFRRTAAAIGTDLSASQAREKLLREALIHCSTDEGPEQEWLNQAREVLALPAADTALREMLARAQEEMRERCVGALRELADRWRAASFHGDADILENNGVEAIRALEVKP